MGHEMSDRDFPILRVRVKGESTDAEIRERFAFFERQFGRGEKVALIIDSRTVGPLSAAQRKMWIDWLSKHEGKLRTQVAGIASFGASGLARGMFTAVFWVWRPPFAVAFVETEVEAERAARSHLDQASGPRSSARL